MTHQRTLKYLAIGLPALVAVVLILYLFFLIGRLEFGTISDPSPTTAIATTISALATIVGVTAAIVAGYFAKKQWETAKLQWSATLEAARREEIRNAQEIHAELLDAYNQVKTVRRHLSAILGVESRKEPSDTILKISILKSDYTEQISILNAAQLVFEIYAKRAKANGLWFSNPPATLLAVLAVELDKGEKYLHHIAVDEYKRKLTKFDSASSTLDLGQLPKLAGFIHEESNKYFNEPFGDPTDRALEQLERIFRGPSNQ